MARYRLPSLDSQGSESRSFFFSSRRRHTRSLCDWSSDVCSSDLMLPRDGLALPNGNFHAGVLTLALDSISSTPASRSRSEERRVGKECRSRWSPSHQKKKDEKNEGNVIDRRDATSDLHRMAVVIG